MVVWRDMRVPGMDQNRVQGCSRDLQLLDDQFSWAWELQYPSPSEGVRRAGLYPFLRNVWTDAMSLLDNTLRYAKASA